MEGGKSNEDWGGRGRGGVKGKRGVTGRREVHLTRLRISRISLQRKKAFQGTTVNKNVCNSVSVLSINDD